MSHHFLWLFHGFLMFCSIFDQKVRKMWRTLGKIWWFSRNHRRMIKQMKKMIKKWKKTRVFLHFWDFSSPGFSWPHFFICFFYLLFFIVLSFIFHFLSFIFHIFIISHHFLWLFHGFLMFCSISDQTMRKMWRALGKIWWFSRNHRKMIKKMINKWKNDKKMKKLEFFCIFGISAHLAFLGSFFFIFLALFFIFYHFSSFSLTFSWISYVLQHFRPKSEEYVTSTWQNLMIFKKL